MIERVKIEQNSSASTIPFTEICCFLFRISSISVFAGDLTTVLSERSYEHENTI